MLMNTLDRLRADLLSIADPELGEYNAKICEFELAGCIHLEYIGSPFDEPFELLCAAIRDSAVAARLGSLILRSSDDEGANGTRNWDITSLLTGADFPVLRRVEIEQNRPGDHNRIIIGSDYDEEGAIGALLQKAPRLTSLAVPSAPNATFFAVTDHPLRHLNVDAGYDTQNFISNLAASASFPSLYALEFGEFNETYLEDFRSRCTPFDDYRRLFRSPAFRGVRLFVWRNPQCSEAEIQELSALRPARDLQFKVISHTSRYVGAT